MALIAVVALVLILVLAAYLWVNARINHVDALSGAPDTPGRTYLIVGSDSRDGWTDDGTEGARTDTIIVLHQPEEGPTALISIPRDSYVSIPGHGKNKINAAFAWGGPELLVATVEQHTGLTIDHYFEVGFTGVADLVDAVGGVELCHDQDVDDRRSKMTWEAGCHEVDGRDALAFVRMRYSDPIGDIGRTQRQQQLISQLAEKVSSREVLGSPGTTMSVADAGLGAVRVSTGTGPWDLVRAALVFRTAQGDDAVTGTPPIVSLNHRVDGAGSTVLLDPDTVDQFWRDIASGAFEPGTHVGGFD